MCLEPGNSICLCAKFLDVFNHDASVEIIAVGVEVGPERV